MKLFEIVLQKHIEYERLNKKLRQEVDELARRFAILQKEEAILRDQQMHATREQETLRSVNIQQKKVIDRYFIRIAYFKHW